MLGAQGDISFTEYGEYALTQGATEVDVMFDFQKESSLYVFEYLYVKSSDDSPDSIVAVPYSQDTRRFKCKLSGAPTDGHSTLFWRVKIPDPLRTICEGNGPQYAIIRPEQHGIAAMAQDEDTLTVLFPELMPDTDWGFEQMSIHKAVNDEVMGFVWTVVGPKLTTGFTIVFQGAPVTNDYTLHWQVR